MKKENKININLETQTSTKENYCPKCKQGKMVVTITQKPGFGIKHIFTSFCPVCGHTIRKVV